MERVNISIEEAKKEPNNWDFEFAYSKLEQLGYRIGLGIIERYYRIFPGENLTPTLLHFFFCCCFF